MTSQVKPISSKGDPFGSQEINQKSMERKSLLDPSSYSDKNVFDELEKNDKEGEKEDKSLVFSSSGEKKSNLNEMESLINKQEGSDDMGKKVRRKKSFIQSIKNELSFLNRFKRNKRNKRKKPREEYEYDWEDPQFLDESESELKLNNRQMGQIITENTTLLRKVKDMRKLIKSFRNKKLKNGLDMENVIRKNNTTLDKLNDVQVPKGDVPYPGLQVRTDGDDTIDLIGFSVTRRPPKRGLKYRMKNNTLVRFLCCRRKKKVGNSSRWSVI